MKKHIIGALFAGVASITSSFAAISIDFAFAQLRDSTQQAENGMIFILVAANGLGELPSLDGEDFLGFSLETGDVLGNDSKIFFSGSTANNGIGDGEASGFADNLTGTNYDADPSGLLGSAEAGSAWGLFWFSGVTDSTQTVVAGTMFGFYQNSTVDSASPYGNTAMVLPSSGSVEVGYYDAGLIGGSSTANTPSVSDFSANFTVVPEPSATLLGLIGVGALFLRRRR